MPDSDVKKLPCACAAVAAARRIMMTAVKNLKNLNFIKRSLLEKDPQFGGRNYLFVTGRSTKNGPKTHTVRLDPLSGSRKPF